MLQGRFNTGRGGQKQSQWGVIFCVLASCRLKCVYGLVRISGL